MVIAQLTLLASLLLLCCAATDPLQDALIHHLGVGDHRFWQGPDAPVTVQLAGSGAHRLLTYQISVGCAEGAATTTSPAASHACQAAILQPLPPSTYANIYELENAAAVGQGPWVRLFGPVDVESIEEYSQPTVLAVYLNLTWGQQQQQQLQRQEREQANSASHCYQATAAVPVHARYPRPLPLALEGVAASGVRKEPFGAAPIGFQPDSSWSAGLQQWWRHVTGRPVVVVKLALPQLLLNCGAISGEACSGDAKGCLSSDWQHAAAAAAAGDGERQELLVWGMPAGSLRHGWWVVYATTLAILAGAAAVLASVV